MESLRQNKQRKRNVLRRRSTVIPLCLLIYAGAMMWVFGRDFIASGRSMQFWLSAAFELLVIAGAFFFLRRKEKLAEERGQTL